MYDAENKRRMPDFKRPDEQLKWEKDLWWQPQVKDPTNIPYRATKFSIKMHHILHPETYHRQRKGQALFPWTRIHDETNRMPVKEYDDNKEWKRFQLYHSQFWSTPEMQQNRDEKLRKMEYVIHDAKLIENSQENLDGMVESVLDMDEFLIQVDGDLEDVNHKKFLLKEKSVSELAAQQNDNDSSETNSEN